MVCFAVIIIVFVYPIYFEIDSFLSFFLILFVLPKEVLILLAAPGIFWLVVLSRVLVEIEAKDLFEELLFGLGGTRIFKNSY